MATVIIPKWIATVNGTDCEVANGVYQHYLKQAGGDPKKLAIPFRANGFEVIEATDTVAIAKAEHGEVCEGRR